MLTMIYKKKKKKKKVVGYALLERVFAPTECLLR